MDSEASDSDSPPDQRRKVFTDFGYIGGYGAREGVKGGLMAAGIGGIIVGILAFLRGPGSVNRSQLIKVIGAGTVIGGLLGFAKGLSTIWQANPEVKARAATLVAAAENAAQVRHERETSKHIDSLNESRQQPKSTQRAL